MYKKAHCRCLFIGMFVDDDDDDNNNNNNNNNNISVGLNAYEA
jgi:hypothetical protein